MKVKSLVNTNYQQTRNAIRYMTISMYQETTYDMLHDVSPIEEKTKQTDQWEMVADSLYNNKILTHKEFLKCVIEIGKVVDNFADILGIEPSVL